MIKADRLAAEMEIVHMRIHLDALNAQFEQFHEHVRMLDKQPDVFQGYQSHEGCRFLEEKMALLIILNL